VKLGSEYVIWIVKTG